MIARTGRRNRRGDRPQVDGGRRCIVSGRSAPRDGLLRFVIGPGGALVLDLSETLPGRGMWISAERAALTRARERALFARAARRPVAVAPDLVDEVERRLTARALNLLGLARRAGALATGFERVRQALAEARVAVLIEARDGAGHGRARLGALARGLPVVDRFDRDALSRSVGRGNVVHAALAPGPLANRFTRECARLDGVRPIEEAGSDEGARAGDRDVTR